MAPSCARHCLGLFALLAIADFARAETIAIVNARAYPMTDAAAGRIDDATIVIRDGRFESVQANAAPPAGARVVDAHGRIVTPGLMNANTRLGLVEVSSLEETRDYGVDSGPLGTATGADIMGNGIDLVNSPATAAHILILIAKE